MLACVPVMAASNPSPLSVRMQNFLVSPATGPVAYAVVRNDLSAEYAGTLRVQFPAGWKVTPAQHALALKPGETKRFPFTIEKGADREDNAYPVKIVTEGSGGAVSAEQIVTCASAPYHKVKVDGDLGEWKDSIPITFATQGKKTTVRTYWNGKQFCLAVEVEEDNLIGLEKASAATGMDAVQFAVGPAPEDGNTPARASRYEFLVASSSESPTGAKCFLLSKPGQAAGPAKALKELECKEVQVAVKRTDKVTVYEVAVPFAVIEDVKADPGREFRVGVLVHDPDGTGVRDMGGAMNLWPSQRNAKAWTSWENVKWGDKIPFDGNIEFGFCSSIH